jgi:hypothetical protein
MMQSQFNNGLVTKDEASGASVRKDVEVQLLSAAPAMWPDASRLRGEPCPSGAAGARGSAFSPAPPCSSANVL